VKILKRLLLVLFVLIVLAITGSLVFLNHIAKRGLPDYNESIVLEGATDTVHISRDRYAVAHIDAVNEHDLYMTTGYVMAQDRLWQMDLLRRITLGRLSEIFGKEYADTDILMRSLRYSEKSKMILDSADADIINALEAYSRGINLYIDKHQKKLPPEFAVLKYKPEEWKPIHTVNLIGYMAWDLKAGWSELILEKIMNVVSADQLADILPDIGSRTSVVFPGYGNEYDTHTAFAGLVATNKKLNALGADVFCGSNNWAVSGRKSATGKPVLANDMHLGLNIPGIWYQIHQSVNGEVNVSGLALPGAPFVIVGHNENIAWGMTNTYVDNMDFYEEKMHPEDSGLYEYMGEWRNIEYRDEVIKTSDGDEISMQYRMTHRGTIISPFKGFTNSVVSMHWVGDEYSNELRSVYLLNKAANWEDFKDALTSFTSISQNIVYADKEGNIGLYCAAGVPVRKRTAVFGLLPGWTDEYDWQGYVPFDELPHSFNPEEGYVCSANNKTAGNDYPYHIGTWYALPYRYDRIKEMLEEKEKFSAEDMKKMQLDQKSKLAEHVLPRTLEILSQKGFEDTTRSDMVSMLKSWDMVLGKNSMEGAVFENYYYRLAENLFADELGDELFNSFKYHSKFLRIGIHRLFEQDTLSWLNNVNTPDRDESFSDIVIKSFNDAADSLIANYGNDMSAWHWGNMHRLTLAHPLSSVNVLDRAFKLHRGAYVVGGDFHTVSPFSFPFDSFDEIQHGSSHRHIYTPGNWDQTQAIIPTGSSGIPASDHYCDQTDDYIRGNYHTSYFSAGKVIEHAKYTMMILPERN